MFESDPITEIVREYTGMEAVGGAFSTYPTVSSRRDDFTRNNQQQQTSTEFSQRRRMHEFDCLFFFLHVFNI